MKTVKANDGNDNKYMGGISFTGTQQFIYKRDAKGQLILDEKGNPIIDGIIYGEPFTPERDKVEYFTEGG